MDSIDKLKNIFADFPTVGQRTAGRFVFYLMRQPKNQIDELVNTILELKNKIKFCSFCFNPFEGQDNLCSICKDTTRNKNLLCIVKKESDLFTIENTKKYKGLYFILQGNLLSIKNSDNLNLQTEALRQRILHPENFLTSRGLSEVWSEIIIATNPTPEGISTSVLIERAIKEINKDNSIKITHLARGIPVGGELEYADEETLESAFEGRK
jgi:recombination protein RecR